jgi:hypothetical protein
MSKKTCSLLAIVSNMTKIVQFDKGMGKIWGVSCKGVQCLIMVNEKKKQNKKILSLNFLIFASLPLKCTLFGAPIRF